MNDLETIVELLEAWRKVFRHMIKLGEITGQEDIELVESFAGALHDQLDADSMAGALAAAIYLLARDE